MKKRFYYTGGAATAVFLVLVCVMLAFSMSNNGIRASVPENAHDASEWVRLVPAVTLIGHIIHPNQFIQEADGDVYAVYRDVVNFNFPGRREVVLTLTRGGEQAEITAVLYILEPARIVEKEAGITTAAIGTTDFFTDFNVTEPDADYLLRFVTDLSRLNLNEPGWHDIDLELNGVVFTSTLRLVDTTPPHAVAADVTVRQGQTAEPGDFVRYVFDVSPVMVSFAPGSEPDVFTPGIYEVEVILEDSHGNRAYKTAVLTVLADTTPPQIHGTADIEVMLGGTIMYRRDVTAYDSFGNSLPFTVDSDEVDLNTPGEYVVVYRAVDANGNQALETITVTVVEVEEAMLDGMLQTVTDRIIQEGMTQREMARAIYNWVRSNISYVSEAPKNSVYEGAYRALKYRSGDCFIFYAISEVLLTRVGIPNMRITRIESATTRHFWNLVNADDEGWYHFDTTPTAVQGLDRFMFTETQAQEYTAILLDGTRSRDYYTYDRELYPEVMP
jgi:hypothetical protein